MYEELFMVLFCPFYTKTQFRTFVIETVKQIDVKHSLMVAKPTKYQSIWLIVRVLNTKKITTKGEGKNKKLKKWLWFATQNLI